MIPIDLLFGLRRWVFFMGILITYKYLFHSLKIKKVKRKILEREKKEALRN